MKDQIKILVLGDDGVGKSAMICTLISNNFADENPEVYQDVSLPQEGAEGTQVIIMDSAEKMETHELAQKVLEADSIVLVYDVNRRESLDHLMSFWLPFIKSQSNVPVVIAGNKADGDARQRNQVDEVTPILQQFRSIVWACFDCSAKDLTGIEDVFWMAQTVVTHPSAPIFDVEHDALTPKCSKVLLRIFRYFDFDGDGFLSDDELRQFQLECFEIPLSNEDISSLRKILTKDAGGGVTSHPAGLNFSGFSGIFEMFIRNHNPQAPWKVFRRFGYDDSLDLTPEEIDKLEAIPECGARDKLSFSYPAELFLQRLFRQCASVSWNGEFWLSESDIYQVFKTVPTTEGAHLWDAAAWVEDWTHPILSFTRQDEAGGFMNMTDWMGHWKMALFLSPSKSRKYLSLLGYNEGLAGRPGVEVINSVPALFSDARQPSIIHAAVLGGPGSGKDEVVDRLCTEFQTSRPKKMQCQSRLARERSEAMGYKIILTEIPEECQDEVLNLENSDIDVAIIALSKTSDESIHSSLKIEISIPADLPRFFVLTHSDECFLDGHASCIPEPNLNDSANKQCILKHCTQRELHLPVSWRTSEVVEMLLQAYQNPQHFVAYYSSLAHSRYFEFWVNTAITSSALLFTTAALYVFYSRLNGHTWRLGSYFKGLLYPFSSLWAW